MPPQLRRRTSCGERPSAPLFRTDRERRQADRVNALAGTEAHADVRNGRETTRALPSWREMDVFAKLRPHCLTEIEQDEEHCLDAMLHWRVRPSD